MKLAEGGLPKGGGIGYEIFDKSDALGATSFVQNINHLRALEGELARTIRAHRPGAGGARAPRAAGAAAVLARQGGGRRPRSCSRCAARWSRSRCARSAISSPRRSTASSPSASRSSTRPAACSPTAPTPTTRRRQRRRAAGRLRAAPARPDRGDRLLGGRAGPRPRAAHRRFRLQPRHPDLGEIRSRGPRPALEPDARGIRRADDGQAKARSRSATSCPARSSGQPANAARRAATRARRPRKSSTTRSRARPRPR